jgi:hypothetical protein
MLYSLERINPPLHALSNPVSLSEQKGVNLSERYRMGRIFLVDVLICPHCGGCLRILCAIVPPDAIVKILGR